MLWFFLIYISLDGGLRYVITSEDYFATKEDCMIAAEDLAWTRKVVLPDHDIEVRCATDDTEGLMG